MAYKNSEGYSGPTAGDAEAKVRKREKRLQAMQDIEDYEHLCRTFRAQAAELGFRFPSDIWLICNRNGKYHKGN
jgi:hypothetical protein